MTTRHVFALDLKDDPSLIAEYELWHTRVWPEVVLSITTQGVKALDIFRTGNRMVLIMEVDASFSFEKKAAADLANPKVQVSTL